MSLYDLTMSFEVCCQDICSSVARLGLAYQGVINYLSDG